MPLDRVMFVVILTCLGMASSALAGQEPTSALPSRSTSASTVQQTPCTQQTAPSFFGWFTRPREANVECVPTSAVVVPAPLVLGIGY